MPPNWSAKLKIKCVLFSNTDLKAVKIVESNSFETNAIVLVLVSSYKTNNSNTLFTRCLKTSVFLSNRFFKRSV